MRDLPGVRVEKVHIKEEAERRPPNSSGSLPPFDQLPCQGPSTAAPTPALSPPPTPPCSLRKHRCVCWASSRTSPAWGSPGARGSETLPAPLPPGGHPQEKQGRDPSSYSGKGSWDTITRGSLNGTCVHFDEGGLGWLLRGGRDRGRIHGEGSSSQMLGDGKPGTVPKPQALMRGPTRSRMWPLKVAPASHRRVLGPQQSQGGQQLRLRSPCFRLKAWVLKSRTLPLWTEDHSSGLRYGPGPDTTDTLLRVGWGQGLWPPRRRLFWWNKAAFPRPPPLRTCRNRILSRNSAGDIQHLCHSQQGADLCL